MIVSAIDNNSIIDTIVFWGTGDGGLKMLNCWKKLGKSPNYFTCNDINLWNKRVKGVLVIPPSELIKFKNLTIFITSDYFLQIEEQINKLKLENVKVLRAVFPYYEFLKNYFESFSLGTNFQSVSNKKKNKICFTLDNGTILGGVEQFVYRTEKLLKNEGIKGVTLIPENKPANSKDSPFQIVRLNKNYGESFFIQCINFYLSSNIDTIICNTPYEFLFAAFYAKKIQGNTLKIHFVCHGNKEWLYSNLVGLKNYIDIFWVVSKKIRNDLVLRGIPTKKIKRLNWRINVPEHLTLKKYSSENQPIKIGYAGRVTVPQKRVDLLIKIAENLNRLNINFIFNIAGNGDFLNEFKHTIKEKKLDPFFIFWGVLPKDKILEFWNKQDLYINCSEYEGHSISQCEALSCGCVPILTDTSGVRDDVIDNKNGFISPINDVNSIVNSICHVYNNRKLLSIMGKYNMALMKKRSLSKDEFISFFVDKIKNNQVMSIRSKWSSV